MQDLIFPPLMTGMAIEGRNSDPFDTAIAQATLGVDAGLIVYNLEADRARATLVLAPDVALTQAMAMLPVAGIGFQNALGALAPPEVAVHLEWNGGIRINGAKCGGFQIAASTTDADQQPDWLCIGLDLPLWPAHEEMGETPDETALYAEGCAEVDAANLIEAWARHTLNWITRWDGEGVKPVHDEWRGLVNGMGEDIDIVGKTGTFLGVDENFGLLLRIGAETTLIPLTHLLKD